MVAGGMRMPFRYLAKECKARPVPIRELLPYSMIAGANKMAMTEPHRITAEEVGRHVGAIIADPGLLERPVLSLKSRKQDGYPEPKPA
jgi:hypothetical protein